MIDGTLVETQRPAWMSAARRGMIELMVEYIDEKRDLGHGVDFREPTGYTPLAIAVQHNQLKLAQLLIEKGADVNTMNNWRDTPLHRACEQGFVEMTQLLMDNGADPLLQDNRNRRAYELARYRLDREIMKIFREDKLANPQKYKYTKLHHQPKIDQPPVYPLYGWELARENKVGIWAEGGPQPADPEKQERFRDIAVTTLKQEARAAGYTWNEGDPD